MYTKVKLYNGEERIVLSDDMKNVFCKDREVQEWNCPYGHTFQKTALQLFYVLRMPTQVDIPLCTICRAARKKCKSYTSKPEINLRKLLGDTELDVASVKTQKPLFRKAVPNNRFFTIDIYAEYQEWTVLVEYDGSYWHRDDYSFSKDYDKTQMMLDASDKHLVVRVRESPLDKLQMTDARLLQLAGTPDDLETTAQQVSDWVQEMSMSFA